LVVEVDRTILHALCENVNEYYGKECILRFSTHNITETLHYNLFIYYFLCSTTVLIYLTLHEFVTRV